MLRVTLPIYIILSSAVLLAQALHICQMFGLWALLIYIMYWLFYSTVSTAEFVLSDKDCECIYV
jgi:hypothetical protein